MNMTITTSSISTLVLLTALGCTALVRAEAEPAGSQQNLKLTQEKTTEGGFAVTITSRGEAKILKKVTPADPSNNTVYYVYHHGFEVLTYKVSPMGTEFREAGMTRKLVKPDYTIKMAGDPEGRIQRITIYSPDFRTTYDGFSLKNQELIPWSDKELANWRKMRDRTPSKTEQDDR